jgi:hypothetical protein
MRLAEFDGQPYSVEMPASAVNADEFEGGDSLFVVDTLEPALIRDMSVISMGRVYLGKRNADVSRD